MKLWKSRNKFIKPNKANTTIMKKLLLSVLFLIVSVSLYAQDTTKVAQPAPYAKKSSKWFFEGSVSLSLGTISHVGITPLIGYRITPKFHAGATLSYFHGWDKTYTDNPAESNLFGGSVFARWAPVKEFFLQVEPAMYSYKVYTSITTNEVKAVPFIFVGAGYNYYINPKVFLIFEAKVDILNDKNSPYRNEWHPFFNAGVGIAL
jgi:hypothetical protein